MADKLRKIIGDKNVLCTRSLLQLIEGQDKPCPQIEELFYMR
jgi:hypothetical protein